MALVITVSCRDEDAVRIPEFESGVSARVFLYPDRSFVNFEDLTKASVAFDVYTFNKNIDEIIYYIRYVDASDPGTTYPTMTGLTVAGSSFVDGKVTELELTAAELTALFNLPGGINYLDGGDFFVFTTEARLTDGRVITATNSAPSITGGGSASFTTTFTVYVGCPSPTTTIAGTYEATMVYNNFGLGVGNTAEVEVTFVGPEPFRYRVTDHTVGLYVPFGGVKYPADFYDICGTTVLQPATSFGPVINLVNPSDPNLLPPVIDLSGAQPQFVLNWVETFNGVEATVRFVKKP